MMVRVETGRLVEVYGRIFVDGQSLEIPEELAGALLASGAVKPLPTKQRRRRRTRP
jgi:hypothetical protein